MNRTSRYVAQGVLALVLGTQALPASAQELRDPTIAPGEAGAPAGRSPAAVDGMSVLVRDGRPFLVVGTRLYGPGDRFGAMRVERISETEVVLNDGNGRVHVSRFSGIERKTVVDPANCTPGKPTQRAKAPWPTRASSAATRSRAPARAMSSPAAGAPCEDRPS